MQTLTAGHAIVRVLEEEGVRYVFGLPGGHILGVYDGLFHSNRIRHVLVRHEHAAACMAAAYAQLTGEPGVCTVTAGPGCTVVVNRPRPASARPSFRGWAAPPGAVSDASSTASGNTSPVAR